MPEILNVDEILREAHRVRDVTAKAVQQMTFDGNFVRAVRLLEGCRGRVVTSGVGKSGLVAQRLAATLTVVGVPAWYLHPTEAMHGDIGNVQGRADVLVLVSRSGDSVELHGLAQYCERWSLPIILITAREHSTLPAWAEVVLIHPGEEACRLQLTPTTSITTANVLCDAVALVLQRLRCFTPRQFAAMHPGGALGRRLLHVQDVMVTGDTVGTLLATDSLRRCAVALGYKRGIVVVESTNGTVVGVVTSGDLARYFESNRDLNEPVATIMTKDCKTISADALLGDAIQLMEEANIMALPVVDAHRKTKGVIHLHDALRAGT